MGIDKILSDFGQKVYDFFIKNSDEGDTILFVVDNDKYSTFFSAEEEKKNFEKAIKSYVNKNGLSLYNDYIAIALASQQVLLAYEKIKDYIQNDTDKAINSVISEFYEFENSSQLYNYYYHRLTDNDNENLWKRVQEIFEAKKRIIKLPGTETGNDANHKYVKYPEEQIKFYKTFKSEDFNTLFSNWFNACYENINQIESDPECEELIEKRFSNSNVNKQTILPILWSYYSSWKKNTKLSDDDKGLYIELYDYDHTFKIAGDVFNRKRNRINPEEKRLYKVFIRESTNWWIGAKDDIPEEKEFVLLIDIRFKDKFPNTNRTEYKYIDEECDYIVFRYSKRPEIFASDFPFVTQLKGGVRLHNNQYLDIPWLLPQCNNDIEIKYTKILPKYNLNEASLLKPILNNIDGLQIKQLEDSNTFSYIETESKSFVEKNIENGNYCQNQLTPQEKAVLKCQQALFLWLATKGKASHLSIHNICLNIIENFDVLKKIDTEYPEYYILQPLFKAGVIELYKTEDGKYYYALSRGGTFPSDKENTENEHSYWKYCKPSVEMSKDISEKSEAFLNSLQSLENSFYREKELFEKWDSTNFINSSAFIKYSRKYFWSSKSYETNLSEIIEKKIPSIFKITNKIYSPTYFCDSNGSAFKLNDDFANPWYPLSWNLCESYIDLKKGKVIFEYDKKNKKLVCKDFTALPIYFARALVCNNPEKLEEPSFWLSYFDSKYKTQVFNNVSEKLYRLLKNKYLEKRDTEIILIKTNAQQKPFSFNNVSDYQLPSKDSYRIFQFKVEEKQEIKMFWQSDIDTNAIPLNRPFGLLIDKAYGFGYVSRTNARFYEDQNDKSNLLFIQYNRMPEDFFDKLKYYKIEKTELNNQLRLLAKPPKVTLKVDLINGISPDYRNINNKILDVIDRKYSFFLNENEELTLSDNLKNENNQNAIFFFGKWALNLKNKISEIEEVEVCPEDIQLNTYEIISFKVKEAKKHTVRKHIPGRGYITVLQKPPKDFLEITHRKPFSPNIKLEQTDNCDTFKNNSVMDNDFTNSVFSLQESLYKWLENIEYATITGIHEFLMSELEKETCSTIYSFYGINPEEKVLNPLLNCGIIDRRKDENEDIWYTLSKKRKVLQLDTNNFHYDYQKHFAGGNEQLVDSEDILIYLMSLLCLYKKLSSDERRNERKKLKHIVFTYNETQKLLNCSDINKLPWQIARALVMIDSKKLFNEEIYLCGCKEYKSSSFKIDNIYYLNLLDEIISAIKQEEC